MAMAYRSFYAGAPRMTTKKGEPSGMIYTTALFLQKLLREEKPDYIVAASDSKDPTFRHKIFPHYKATRQAMPKDLSAQMEGFWQLIDAFQIPMIQKPGFEADDIIGSLCKKWANSDCQIYIVSGDKDLMQLINDDVFLYAPKKNQPPLLIDRSGVFEKFGVKPEQIIDFLALMGDSSDHIPGVKGVGEKTASALLKDFESLDHLYQNIERVKPAKLQEKLSQDKKNAYMSKELVTLNTSLPLEESLEQYAIKNDSKRNEGLYALYERYDFQSLIPKNQKVFKKKTKKVLSHSKDLAKLEDFLKKNTETPLYLTVETDGTPMPHQKAAKVQILLEATIFDLDLEPWPELLHAIFCERGRKLVSCGWKESWQALKNIGIELKASLYDLSLMDHLVDANQNQHDEQSLVLRHLDADHDTPLTSYLSFYPDLYGKLDKKMNAGSLWRVYEEVEKPLIKVLAQMELTGVYVDANRLLEISKELAKTLRVSSKKIYQLAGHEFNIASPKQLQVVLFDELEVQKKLGIKNLKRTKTGYSTDESVLQRLKDHPIALEILTYRETQKLKSTYVDALPQFLDKETNRLHGRFNQFGTATGRLSSEQPNLQNIPMRSSMGKEIRKAFCAEDPKGLILSADYSQIEIRLLAAFAQSDYLIKAFQKGADIHRSTAQKIFNLKEDQVDSASRSKAKAVNFGILYGMGPQRLALTTGVGLSEAKEFIDKYFEAFPEIKEYTENLKQKARKLGYSETIMGRRRPMTGILDQNRGIQSRWENIAVNAPIQGSAADLIKIAMARIDQHLRDHKMTSRLLIQVHDELVFETSDSELARLKGIVKPAMESALILAVPLKVDMGAGRNWLEAHD